MHKRRIRELSVKLEAMNGFWQVQRAHTAGGTGAATPMKKNIFFIPITGTYEMDIRANTLALWPMIIKKR